MNGNFGISLNVGSGISILPSTSEKLLGGIIANDLKWNEQVKGNSGSIFNSVVSRVNALRKLSHYASFKARKMIANGIIISRLTYLIEVWGGCPDYLLDMLQSVQNRAARIVCNSWDRTPTKSLLRSCGWLSIRQLVVQTRIMLVFKIRRDGRPCYFKEKFSNETNPGYKTRFQVQEKIKKSRIYKYEEAKKSFVPNSIDLWNRLPHEH